MSSHEDEFIAGLKESGKMDRLMQAAGLAKPEAPAETADTATAPEAEAPAVEETVDTVEEPEEVVDANEDEVDETDVADAEATDEEELFLDLTPEVEEYLEKYGGDINRALEAARNAQSKIGEQGNRIGELQEQLTRIEQGLTAGAFEPYEWPDPELDDPMDAVNGFHRVAEQAFARKDAQAFEAALGYMNQIDPIRTQMYAQAKAAEVATLQTPEPQQSLDTLVADFRTKNPDIAKPEIAQAVEAELEKFPSLARIFSDPNGDPAERVAVLQEVYDRVSSRQTADTVKQAARRVAVRTSEEARNARAAAKVAVADQRGAATSTADRPDTVIRLKNAEGGSFNVSELHRQSQSLADGTPEMVLKNGRMYVRQPDGSLVPRAE